MPQVPRFQTPVLSGGCRGPLSDLSHATVFASRDPRLPAGRKLQGPDGPAEVCEREPFLPRDNIPELDLALSLVHRSTARSQGLAVQRERQRGDAHVGPWRETPFLSRGRIP